MRFLNILLVCMAIGVLATGAYVLGSKVKRDADDELTTPITASAAAATAESSLKPALYAANAYYVDQFDLPGDDGRRAPSRVRRRPLAGARDRRRGSDELLRPDRGRRPDLQLPGSRRSRRSRQRLLTDPPAGRGQARPSTFLRGRREAPPVHENMTRAVEAADVHSCDAGAPRLLRAHRVRARGRRDDRQRPRAS